MHQTLTPNVDAVHRALAVLETDIRNRPSAEYKDQLRRQMCAKVYRAALVPFAEAMDNGLSHEDCFLLMASVLGDLVATAAGTLASDSNYSDEGYCSAFSEAIRVRSFETLHGTGPGKHFRHDEWARGGPAGNG